MLLALEQAQRLVLCENMPWTPEPCRKHAPGAGSSAALPCACLMLRVVNAFDL